MMIGGAPKRGRPSHASLVAQAAIQASNAAHQQQQNSARLSTLIHEQAERARANMHEYQQQQLASRSHAASLFGSLHGPASSSSSSNINNSTSSGLQADGSLSAVAPDGTRLVRTWVKKWVDVAHFRTYKWVPELHPDRRDRKRAIPAVARPVTKMARQEEPNDADDNQETDSGAPILDEAQAIASQASEARQTQQSIATSIAQEAAGIIHARGLKRELNDEDSSDAESDPKDESAV
ncbi:hypothetical protein CAOG_06604 [Capsaspora owczarzaki ATCC 30864]|uniref:Uncharacterized protein n=1 Tax=Capsaspora owczarzaki (strain ATCC 30864) TaxID=595528 RepID=A0A0D2WUC8_CAPO3|nr:hypothetical protein CAOG_06604 [Capsaspora owczarzaki ATCC 30864]KJE96250.1 hypothetical protein CAOG_006604 [Capsaspora owczarzaki ATCC 30864]|eukprot:XP_004344225.1 hypothetical protein CAOG_06604 [Capsaspora owczarzaki ATCC 30864]